MSHAYEIIERAVAGRRPAAEEARALAGFTDLPALTAAAARLRDAGFGGTVTYSRKVFIPLTQLCRDVCHYCTFAHPPRKGERAYLTPDEVLDVARRGREAGCREALFTLGDKPERRYRVAAEELAALGFRLAASSGSAFAAMYKAFRQSYESLMEGTYDPFLGQGGATAAMKAARATCGLDRLLAIEKRTMGME